MLIGRETVRCLLVCCIALLVPTVLYGFQSVPPAKSAIGDNREKKNLRLVVEYKQDHLMDVSSDGQNILFYRTSTPMRTYTYRPGSGVKPDQPQTYDDMLRIVELERGREVTRVASAFFPYSARFIPGTHYVLYLEPNAPYKLWDISSGQTRICVDAQEGSFAGGTLLDQQRILGTMLRKDGRTSLAIAKLNVPDCAWTMVNVLGLIQGRISSNLALSPDKRLSAYTLYASHEVIISDIIDKKIAKTLDISPLYFGSNAAFTPDRKLLLVDAHTHPFGGEGAKDFLLFYDTKTYQVVRRLDLPRISAIAVSPDSRTLAIAYKKEEPKTLSTDEQGFIVLYDLVTGEELATASHPALKQRRSDPFAAMINRLAFTPDGKYLLSSAYDTRVWRID